MSLLFSSQYNQEEGADTVMLLLDIKMNGKETGH